MRKLGTAMLLTVLVACCAPLSQYRAEFHRCPCLYHNSRALHKNSVIALCPTISHAKNTLPEAEFCAANHALKAQEKKLPLPQLKYFVQEGVGSWYGQEFHGRRTSSGELYNMYAMTAAHRALPLSSYAQVTNKKNGRSIIVRINDRGPFHKKRVIDLSFLAAQRLGYTNEGSALLKVEALLPQKGNKNSIYMMQPNPIYRKIFTTSITSIMRLSTTKYAIDLVNF